MTSSDMHLLPEKPYFRGNYKTLKLASMYQASYNPALGYQGPKPGGPQLPTAKTDAASLIKNDNLNLRQKLELTKGKPQDRFEVMAAEVKKNPEAIRNMPKDLVSLDGLKLGGNAQNGDLRMVLQALPSENVSLAGADLTGQNLSGPNMNLAGANFAGANLTSATLIGADLTRANFDGATLRDTKFNGAQMAGAKLINIKDAAGADFSDVKGNNIVLANSDFSGAKFNSDFNRAVTSDVSQLKKAVNVSFPTPDPFRGLSG
jgi:uncharacterized protein YjbI with pentapeptide repeats